MSPPVNKFPCIVCNEKCKNGTSAIQCAMCDLWIHQKCAEMDNETYKLICNLVERGQDHFWSCKCCSNASRKLNKMVLALEKRVTTIESTVKTNTEIIGKVDEKVDKVAEEVATLRREDNSKKVAADASDGVFKELSEREARKDNIIIYKLAEAPLAVKNGQNRKNSDVSILKEVFTVMSCDINIETDIKFIARAGEFTDKVDESPRPLIIGFRNSQKREELLNNVRKLSRSKFKNISISTDLTTRQRKEDAQLRKEAEQKNEEMSEEEALNWEWVVVGQRGQRRLIKRKRIPETQENQRKRQRSSDADLSPQSQRVAKRS